MHTENKINIAIVSPRQLVRQGLAKLVEGITYPVKPVLCASKIEEVFEGGQVPDIVLLHIDNNDTAEMIIITDNFKLQYPAVHILVIPSIFNDELLKQLRQSDAGGYLFMYSEPADFKAAFCQVMQGRKYYQRPQFSPGDFDNISHIIRSFFD